MFEDGYIEVTGARVHNLKNISVKIPRHALTVITGLSGSGKSSLAFDTIFAEGQRRYLDTFSSYARGYIGNMQRPDVDKITGLSPVISIDQKTTSRNPRSTVGTITEIYDYLRLLYARAGEAHSYLTGEKMVHYTDEQIIDLIRREYAGKKVLLMAPLVKNRKGHYKELFDTLRKKGYLHVRVDGEVQELQLGMKVDRYKQHTIEVVVDRLLVKDEGLRMKDERRNGFDSVVPLPESPMVPLGDRTSYTASAPDGIGETEDMVRLRQSVDKAMTQGDGVMIVCEHGSEKVRYLSRNLMCPTTGLSYADPAPHTFSFNSPQGWCPCCKGLGRIRLEQGSMARGGLSDEVLEDVVHDADWYEKLVALANTTGSAEEDVASTEEEQWTECPVCHGKRLNQEALSYKIAGYGIADLAEMDIDELVRVVKSDAFSLKGLTATQLAVAKPIVKEIGKRLEFMQGVGLSYLSLNRSSDSLSGGESQRIRLATQIGSRLVNVLYILDEPSIGLHQRDNERLIRSLKELRDMGNSVIVVEHDEQMMREADYVVDIGPKAGRLGGEVLFAGTPEELMQTDTLTGRYLKQDPPHPSLQREGEDSLRLPLQKGSVEELPSSIDTNLTPSLGREDRGGSSSIILRGCRGNNLKDVTVAFPIGKMIGVTGVSGSGKSTLINQTLYPILSQKFYRSLQKPLAYDSIEGIELIDKVINVDQSPIGRTPRSNPATYTGVFNSIRDLFAQLPEAKIRGWKAGRFSFNAKGGRCEECAGNGYKTIQMHFMPDVYVPCEACSGQRYNRETLEVRFKGKTIADVLDMTVNQAVEFFESQPYILRKIKTIQDVGLGYIKLGQSSTSLSGGESQRIKLATELARPSTGRTLYILDEPTTGLHFEDIRVLMGVLRRLVDKGNTVVIIEHNLDVIRACDWLIDMGPEGGKHGGTVVACGTQDDLRRCAESVTGRYL
ncbi:MAG: excinuclease ABC subunit UvrA [Bacteroidales bacterium]|nr:excinuclease ABC subunit UvrA [Bacteroidales bacterium]